MKYQILLEDRKNGRKALIECPANMLLEELSVKIKVELCLPLCDRQWHRFLYRGRTYVPEDHLVIETEMRWESTQKNPPTLYNSEMVRLKQLYTVLGSAIMYHQDDYIMGKYRVRCTLVARV